MNFRRRLRFYGLGVILGILLSLVLFGPEKFNCSGYLPEGRVLAELQTKKFQNDSIINRQLDSLGLGGDAIKDSILKNASIKFDESEPRKKPCGQYSVYYPEETSKMNLTIFKCDSTAYISDIKYLN